MFQAEKCFGKRVVSREIETVSPHIRSSALEVVQTLREAGFEAFWVGGCVRDHLLGREPLDYDLATSAKPEEVERLFKSTLPLGRAFGVVMVKLDGFWFQVATFRSESGYQDGRRPGRVEFADARADALRRDFTVNGLFYDPVAGVVHDWVDGRRDLDAGIIRTIGKPHERFQEDHLRMLRAVRFAAQLGFSIEPATLAAIREGARDLARISAERVREELCKTFQPPHSARGLELLQSSGLLRVALPELEATVDCEQSPDHHPEGSVFKHILKMLECLPPNASTNLVWAVLLHDIAKPVTASRDAASGAIHFYGHEKTGAGMAEAILGRLRFPRRLAAEIVVSVRNHMQFKDVKKMRRSTLRHMLMRPTFGLELELHRLDCLGSSGDLGHYEFLVSENQILSSMPKLHPPLVNGRDLIRLGMKPGMELGAVLREIREKQLADEITSRRQALAWVKRKLAGTN